MDQVFGSVDVLRMQALVASFERGLAIWTVAALSDLRR